MRKQVTLAFNVICFIATFSMIGYWSFQYLKDKDLSFVDYELVEDLDQPYPTFSFCFKNPFIEKAIKEIDPRLNSSLYRKFLEGKFDEDKFQNDNVYENVTISIKDKIIGLVAFFRNGDYKIFNETNYDEILEIHESYNGYFATQFHKCFGLELKKTQMKTVEHFLMYMNHSMFEVYPDGFRPYDGSFKTFLHYPDHFVTSIPTGKVGWPEQGLKSNYIMHFLIKMVEILRRRNKDGKPCLAGNDLDSRIIRSISKEAGCRAPYLSSKEDFPLCVGKDAIKKAKISRREFDLTNIVYPCEVIANIEYDYSEKQFSKGKQQWGPNLTIGLWITFPERMKIIQHAKEITFNSLVGNCGGYIGLFLGKFSNL